jgi:hypothetical protein
MIGTSTSIIKSTVKLPVKHTGERTLKLFLVPSARVGDIHERIQCATGYPWILGSSKVGCCVMPAAALLPTGNAHIQQRSGIDLWTVPGCGQLKGPLLDCDLLIPILINGARCWTLAFGMGHLVQEAAGRRSRRLLLVERCFVVPDPNIPRSAQIGAFGVARQWVAHHQETPYLDARILGLLPNSQAERRRRCDQYVMASEPQLLKAAIQWRSLPCAVCAAGGLAKRCAEEC